MSSFGAECNPATFGPTLTELTRVKLTEAVQYVPFSEEDSAIAVQAGWFCIEPAAVSTQPLQGADEFHISYVGAQDGPNGLPERTPGVREMVISLSLFKDGQPFAFETDVDPATHNDYSILSGAYLTPTIVSQQVMAEATERLDYVRSTLGNWEALGLAKQDKTVDARRLNASECRAVLETIATAQVDNRTLFRYLKEAVPLAQ